MMISTGLGPHRRRFFVSVVIHVDENEHDGLVASGPAAVGVLRVCWDEKGNGEYGGDEGYGLHAELGYCVQVASEWRLDFGWCGNRERLRILRVWQSRVLPLDYWRWV